MIADLMHRRLKSKDRTNEATIPSPPMTTTRTRSKRPPRRLRAFRIYQTRCPCLFSKLSTLILLVAFTIWTLSVIHNSQTTTTTTTTTTKPRGYLSTRERIKERIKERAHVLKHAKDSKRFQDRMADAAGGIADAAVNVADVAVNVADAAVDAAKNMTNALLNAPMPLKKNKEALPEGCVRPEWQTQSRQNCNDIHDISFLDTLAQREILLDNIMYPLGHIASGLWRQVWSTSPRSEATKPVVLKVMKKKHDVTDRNFDRHRRDAIVMEQLSSSPNVVDIYGFCGNTVATEFLATPLDVVTSGDAPEATVTRETPEGRLHLMIEATKGLRDLHEIKGGPIVHADVGARQFLVRENGMIAVNDFNRCRFMAHRNTTNKPCGFMIPSAPGKSRSPEEYNDDQLDEKLDVFSLGNVYFTILYKHHPWEAFSTQEAKSLIKKGNLPVFKSMDSPIDRKLIEITKRAFEFDARKRPSASELLRQLEDIRNGP